MRKDLRVGLGIGGVLLAVLIVALVVRTHKDPTPLAHNGQPPPPEQGLVDPPPDVRPPDDAGTRATIADEVPPVPPPDAIKPPVDNVFGDPVADIAPPAATARRSTPPIASGGTNWEYLLATGQMADARATPVVPRPVSPANVPPANVPPAPFADRSLAGGNPADQIIERSPNPPTPARGTTIARTGTTPPRAPGNVKTRVVRDGDSLSTIARDVYGNKKYHVQLQAANPGVNPQLMRVGTTLIIPDLSTEIRAAASAPAPAPGSATARGSASIGPRGTVTTVSPLDARRNYRVQAGDSLSEISMKLYGMPGKVDALYDLNRVAIGPDRDRLKLHLLLQLPEPPTIASLR